jgi:hypothetical protein
MECRRVISLIGIIPGIDVILIIVHKGQLTEDLNEYVFIFQAQFFIVTIHNSQLLFIDCDYPWKYVAFIQGFTTTIAALFLNFYIKTYNKSKSIANSKSNGAVNGHIGNGDVVTNGNYIEPAANGSVQTHKYLHQRKHVNTHI